MTATAVATVQNSFEQILSTESQSEHFAKNLYGHFFHLVPSAESLFVRTNWEQQRKMLVSALTLMVKNLHNPTMFRSTMLALGQRHIRYGMRAEHFPPFREALHFALREELGTAYTTEVASAWDHALDRVSELMMQPTPI